MSEDELIRLAQRGQIDPDSLTESEIRELAIAVLPEFEIMATSDN